jgi:hypothetical protein
VELRPAHQRIARLAVLAAAVALALLLALAGPARAANQLQQPKDFYKPPTGYKLSADKVLKIADRTTSTEKERKKFGQLNVYGVVYTNGPGRWQVSYFHGKKEVAQIAIEDNFGGVLEQWTGPQVAWRMARGYEGQFGRKLNAVYIFLPMCVLFMLPFFDWRHPFRLLHLDLLVLLSFAISHIYFNKGEIFASTPLAYPPMVYLLLRMMWIGFRGKRPRRPQKLIPWMPVMTVGLLAIFLIGFRVALNIVDGRVIDVGYAGEVGADRIADGDQLYGKGQFPKDVGSGDTYGPVNYLAYVPWEQLIPWKGTWDELPAAHGAALTFDLLTITGLFLLGRRLRAGPEGTALGVALVYGWSAYPYTDFVLQSNSNDALVSMFVVWALVFLRSPPARGLMVGLAAAAKFTPIVLAPLFAMASDEKKWRRAVLCSVVVLATIVATFLPFIPPGGVHEIYDRTLGFQIARNSPFSIWGQHDSLNWLHTVVKVFAGGLALLVAFVPWRKSALQIAALGGAVMVAMELTAAHWFYLYIVWFFPLVFVALALRYDEGAAEWRNGGVAEDEVPAREAEPALT